MQEKRHDRVVEMRLCFFLGKVGDYNVSFVETRMCRSTPTLAPAIEKSDYEPKTPETDASVDADTVNDATAFLETFFKLYQTATEKELAYYVSGNVIESIGRDYLYSELVNPIFTKDGDNVKVKVAVKFLDNQKKATQVSQYELVLHKDSNWKLVG